MISRLVHPPTMQQHKLCELVRRFVDDSSRATLVVAAPRDAQLDVELALVFFLSDFANERFPSVLYSTKSAHQTERCATRLEQQLTDYTLELRTPGARQYVQERVQMRAGPQCPFPDFTLQRHRVLFRERTEADFGAAATSPYPLSIYDHLNRGELKHMLELRDGVKRVLVLYVWSSDHVEQVKYDCDAGQRAFYDPTVHYYEMH